MRRVDAVLDRRRQRVDHGVGQEDTQQRPHQRGGDLTCAPQSPARSCNERSLLRRHGPGVKLVETRTKIKKCIPRTRTVMTTVERQVERTRETISQPLVLDGGVGQGVY